MNDGSGINEWACSACGTHIGDGDPLVRVTFALDRAGMRNLLAEPELLLGDEYCTPECAIKGSINMLWRLKGVPIVGETFGG